jgi:hypothetical protein
MTASKSLAPRASLESLCKQARKLARDIVARDDAAIARVRAHLPHVDLLCGLPLQARRPCPALPPVSAADLLAVDYNLFRPSWDWSRGRLGRVGERGMIPVSSSCL